MGNNGGLLCDGGSGWMWDRTYAAKSQLIGDLPLLGVVFGVAAN